MNRKIVWALACAAGLGSAWGAHYYRSGMDAQEVVRKLAGLRIALTLYAADHKGFPSAFEETIREGKLEGAPGLKLAGHFSSASVRNTPAFKIRDSGAWAYVNDPRAPDFGLVFIDCSHKDEKGRFWSEF